MNTIQLTEAEHQLLVENIGRASLHLREEIIHTDEYAYREALKEREQQPSRLLPKIKSSLPSMSVTDQQEQ